jgi:hypothetical protein
LRKSVFNLFILAILTLGLIFVEPGIGLVMLTLAMLPILIRAALTGYFYFSEQRKRYTDVTAKWPLPPPSLQGTMDQLQAAGYSVMGAFSTSVVPQFVFFTLGEASRTVLAELVEASNNAVCVTLCSMFSDGAMIETDHLADGMVLPPPVSNANFSLLCLRGDLDHVQRRHQAIVESFHDRHGTPLRFESLTPFYEYMHTIGVKAYRRHLFPIFFAQTIFPALWLIASVALLIAGATTLSMDIAQSASLMQRFLNAHQPIYPIILIIFVGMTILLFGIRFYNDYRVFQVQNQ